MYSSEDSVIALPLSELLSGSGGAAYMQDTPETLIAKEDLRERTWGLSRTYGINPGIILDFYQWNKTVQDKRYFDEHINVPFSLIGWVRMSEVGGRIFHGDHQLVGNSPPYTCMYNVFTPELSFESHLTIKKMQPHRIYTMKTDTGVVLCIPLLFTPRCATIENRGIGERKSVEEFCVRPFKTEAHLSGHLRTDKVYEITWPELVAIQEEEMSKNFKDYKVMKEDILSSLKPSHELIEREMQRMDKERQRQMNKLSMPPKTPS
jgi:hypothetical protein